ncbi:MAG: hypothetical protein HYW25_00855 [Candidatus Aenigmarchaeota archaeon]|nr:hypothetical protein [Candidatus Aenigmarchaeota archaeon]
MKSIKELKNPDIIEINGQKFQVVENTSVHYDTKKKELVMALYLVREGERKITPKYRLEYFHDRPDEIRFFIFDENSKNWKEEKIESVNF